ncbi:MAG: O-succinylhomoserine sulfhydrylase [Proteobacteria bacterium]|nr:O-succinylhomoserine sulfhydrylase [Pseudomonadota bacterium]
MAIKRKDPTSWRPATRMVRGGTLRSPFAEMCEGIFMTSGFVYDEAAQAEDAFAGANQRFIYSRYSNPTVSMLEERLALIEGAEACRATASGMAAMFAALMCQLKAGDRVVSSRALFGACHYIISTLLPRYGMESVFVDGTDYDQWRDALSRPTACVFLETPSNPTTDVIDLRLVCDLAHAAGAKVIVDNVFATAVLQKPMEAGADLVMYSATKHIDGQGRALGGAILCDRAFIDQHLQTFLRNTGPSISPFNAWLLLKGLETLELRVNKMSDNALEIARFLEGRNGIRRVLYPGLASHPQHELAMRQMKGAGTMVAFEIDGGKKEAFAVVDRLKVIDISNNLGDAKSIATHPATTTHQRIGAEERARLGIADGLIRLSIGLEDVEDLKEDIAQALRGL